ncbi:hypothetical protein LC612_28255 [Nostoc sp. CHAB 5834]|nr:hypothetical protein [Nostoc sp. CHAB 5834]
MAKVNIEKFYRELMVPTAQLGMLLSVILDITNPYRKDTKYLQTLFDSLHFVNAGLCAKNLDVSHMKLRAVLNGIQEDLVGLLTLYPKLIIEAAVKGEKPRVKLIDYPSGNTANSLKSLSERIVLQKNQLFEAINLAGESSQQWRTEHVNQSHPLTRGGAIGKWTTLAKNGSWTPTLKLLDVSTTLAGNALQTFGSRQGQALLPELMEAAFNPEQSSELELNLLVPKEISISTTGDGYIQLKAVVPAFKFSKKQREEFDNKIPADILEKAKGEEKVLIADLGTLDEQLGVLVAWVTKTRKIRAVEMPELITKVSEQSRVGKLREKLDKTFTADELKLLEQILKPKRVRKASGTKSS